MKRTLDYYIAQGVPKVKINVGLALFGVSWRLINSAKTGVGAPANGQGINGPCTPGAWGVGSTNDELRLGLSMYTRPPYVCLAPVLQAFC